MQIPFNHYLTLIKERCLIQQQWFSDKFNVINRQILFFCRKLKLRFHVRLHSFEMFKGNKSTTEHDLRTYVLFLEHSLSWMGLYEGRIQENRERGRDR